MRAFVRQMKLLSTVEAVGQALAPIGALFEMPNVLISDVTKAVTAPAAVPIFSTRSLSDTKRFAERNSLAINPVVHLAWTSPVPVSLSEIRQALKLDQEGLWSLVPPWSRGTEALSINIQLDHRAVWNVSYAGIGGDVGAVARSVLLVASRMACERLREIEYVIADASRLSAREEQALRLAAAGRSDADIGKRMGIAPRTVRFHIDNAKDKLGVASRAQAVLKFLRGQSS